MKKHPILQWKILPRQKWGLAIEYGKIHAVLTVDHVNTATVKKELCPSVMPFADMAAYNWTKPLHVQLRSYGCAASYAMVPGSLVMTDADGNPFERDRDYMLDDCFGTLMRKPDSRIGDNQPVYLSYRYRTSRIDSIVLTPDGNIVQRQGKPDLVHQFPPKLLRGETRLLNLYFTGQADCLREDMIFPIETTRLPKSQPQVQFLPNTMKRLHTKGATLRVLAWGDSVTECAYLPEKQHYQNIFVKRLQKRYPDCRIELRTVGWGGRTTRAFLEEPSGSQFNYQEQVLAWKPDLVVSEFVNDCGSPLEMLKADHQRIADDFHRNGIEWLILTPHYIKLSWMGLNTMKNCDEDPRQYVHFIRDFAKENGFAIADAAKKYGALWHTGIPFMCFMTNTINHPDVRGMKLYADSLMEAISEK